ncbi:MAG: hypothetical protein KIT00_07440, partial [Rhodospirillales bacterium]|nr:hypothetical protein [Rhodospirillales bacterium]
MFAKSVISEWFKQLRGLPDNLDMVRYLYLSGEVLQALTDEIVTASDRGKVEEKLIEALKPLEQKRSTTRIGIVDQQVMLATNVVNEFVDFLGFADVPLAERPASPMDGRKIFQSPEPVDRHRLPELSAEELPYTGTYIVDWLEAFRKLAIGNAGHSAGREITPEQNQQLGEILGVIRGGPALPA